MTQADLSWIAAVNRFWFEELKPEDWFSPHPEEIDAKIRARFAALYERLRQSPPAPDDLDAAGHVAAVIVFDQFPRNLFRHSPRAFETGPLALALARDALDKTMDAGLGPHQRQFLYMPFVHSEDARDQARSLELFQTLGLKDALAAAQTHKDVIARFGRFPFRNEALGRPSTDAERKYMRMHKPF